MYEREIVGERESGLCVSEREGNVCAAIMQPKRVLRAFPFAHEISERERIVCPFIAAEEAEEESRREHN